MGSPPIDRGWAWMCVLGASVCNFFFTGYLRAMGIVMVEVMERYNCSAAVTGIMFGVWSAVLGLFSPIVNRLGVRYTYRKVLMAGGFLFALSYFLLSISPNFHSAAISIGLFGGIGFCSIFGPPLVVVGQYFNVKRSLANGLTTAGGSLGQLTLPLFIRYLLDTYGFTNAFIIFGAFALHTIPAAALFRPFSFYTARGQSDPSRSCEHSVPNNDVEIAQIQDAHVDSENDNKNEHPGWNDSEQPVNSRVNELKISTSQCSLNSWTGSAKYVNHLKYRQEIHASTASLSVLEYQRVPDDIQQQEYQEDSLHQNVASRKLTTVDYKTTSLVKNKVLATFCCICATVPQDTKPWMEWSLFRNYMFVCYIFGICLANTGVVYCCVYLPPRAMDIGVDKRTAALLLTIVGASDFFGRIFGGWFADLGYLKRYQIVSGTLAFTGVTILVCNHIESYTSFIFLACVLGFIGGTYLALFVVLLIDFMGIEKLPSASGLAIMCLSLFNIPIPTIIGTLKDSTGTFQTAYTMLAVFIIAGSLCYALEPVVRKLETRKK